MIKLKEINLLNFLSHKDTRLQLGDNSKLLLDGQSGSGKSSIIEALVWGLYGIGRSDNRNMVKNGAKIAQVELILEEGGVMYKILRTTTPKAKNSLNVLSSGDGINYLPIERNGSRDLQEWIEKDLLHSSYALFTNSVVYPQDNPNSFVKQTAAKRKDLLLEIANVSDFDMYYTRAKEALQLQTEESLRAQSEMTVHLSNLESLKTDANIDIEGVKEKISELSDSIASRKIELEAHKKSVVRITEIAREIQKTRDAIDNKDRDIWETKQKLLVVVKEVAELEDMGKFDVLTLEDKIAVGKSRTEEFELLDAKIKEDYERSMKMNALMADKPAFRDYEAEIGELKNRLFPLLKDSQSCPAGDDCPFVVPIKNQVVYLQEQIVEKTKKKDELEKAMFDYQERIRETKLSIVTPGDRTKHQELSKSKYETLSAERDLALLKMKIAALPKEIEEEKVLGDKLDVLDKEARAMEKEIEKLEKEQSMYSGSMKEIDAIENRIRAETQERENLSFVVREYEATRKKMKDLEEKIGNVRKRISEINAKIERLGAVKEAFGSKGIKTVVIDYLIPTLEDRINEILGRLSDFRVRLDTQRASADGSSTIEGLYINITNGQGEEFGYDNFSGGEKVKITMAISEALATLQKCGFRVLDEAIVALDKESTEALIEVLAKIMQRFDQMICVSHLPEIKERFEERVVITKVGGTSTIK